MDFLTELGPGDRLGAYQIVRRLGEGGMGVVFEAHDQHGRRAAVKVLSTWLTTELGRQRFEREVTACAGLQHPNTVTIFDYGVHEDGTLYYAMEYLDGFDLGRLIELDGPQSAGRTIRILRPIAGALGEAHARHLIHRDIKPANILLCRVGGEPDVAKLVDFGLVMPTDSARQRRLTSEGRVLGSPRYVAPEMLQSGGHLGPGTDFYALGLVAYFLLSGQHAFEGEGRAEILRKQRDEQAPPLTEVARHVPPDLASVVHWCLEKDPEHRPHDAFALRDALSRCASAEHWDETDANEWWAAWAEEAPSAEDDLPSMPTPSSAPPASERDRAN